jgi:6-phosphogluconolactonase
MKTTRRAFHRWSMCLAIAIAAFIMFSTPLPAFGKTIVYISNADSREIYVLELVAADGSVREIQKVSTAGNVMPLAISHDRKFLYASLRSEPWSVSAFAINPITGELSAGKTVPLADNMAYLSTDRTGRYLLAASFAGSRISVNRITAPGEVDPTPLAVIPTGKNAHAIVTDPSNNFVFVTNLGDDQILQYRFEEATGRLGSAMVATTKKGAGPRHLVFHPSRPLLFNINELDGTVDSWRLNATTGALTHLNTASLMPVTDPAPPTSRPAPSAADIHITPDGKFLYTTERSTNTIAGFRVDAENGKLTLLATYPTETQPRGFNIDPAGKYLIVAGQKSNGLSTYAIDRDQGTLRFLHRREVGKNPNWIEIIETSE